MSRVCRNGQLLTLDEHRDLAGHFYAIRHHANAILFILNSRARAKWLDQLNGFLRDNGLGKLRSALDDDYPMGMGGNGTPYFGEEQRAGTFRCPAPGPTQT